MQQVATQHAGRQPVQHGQRRNQAKVAQPQIRSGAGTHDEYCDGRCDPAESRGSPPGGKQVCQAYLQHRQPLLVKMNERAEWQHRSDEQQRHRATGYHRGRRSRPGHTKLQQQTQHDAGRGDYRMQENRGGQPHGGQPLSRTEHRDYGREHESLGRLSRGNEGLGEREYFSVAVVGRQNREQAHGQQCPG